MIHNKNISRWVEFAPIDTYRIDGIGRHYMREKNIPTRPFTCVRLSMSIALAWSSRLPNVVKIWAVPVDLENGTIKAAAVVNLTK